MNVSILGGIAILGLLVLILGIVMTRNAESPDGAYLGLFLMAAAVVVWILDLLALGALGLWSWLG